jgi:hypothetical protein
MRKETYEYRNLPIPGGGYVTGFIFHEKQPGIFYCRTDIGGVYRYKPEERRWKSLIDHVTMDDLRETFPAAVALDPKNPNRLYIASGIWNQPPGKLAVSEDCGEHFSYHDMPFRVHGNLNGRGTGYRLVVDRKDADTLYYASQADGLWKSNDRGASWEKLDALREEYTTFVGQTPDGAALFVGTAGVTTKRSDRLRGKSLYVSYDNGATFSLLTQPKDGAIDAVAMAGLVAQRYALDEKYLYVTFSVMGANAYVRELGYSCDGGSTIGGKVVRYPLLPDGTIGSMEEITPPCPPKGNGVNPSDSNAAIQKDAEADLVDENGARVIPYGFSGISAAAAEPGLLVASSINKEDGDCIFRSRDYGATWEVILYDLEIGRMDFRTSYLRPEYNGGHNLIHWLTDLKINPFRPEELWFNTGTGVFRTENLLDSTVVFYDWSDGIEETVHLNLYSPPKGEVKLIDILGDLGGFAFRKLDEPCRNSFDDADGNRYITCINADYSDENPNVILVTPRGNWTGKTKGGLIRSKDQGTTFRRLPMPFGITEKLDRALARIECPNVNSGWVALSADTQNVVWSVAENIFLPADMVLVSNDGGEHFAQAKVYDLAGRCISQAAPRGMKVFSDRMDSQLFYGFGEHFEFYISKDAGRTFHQRELPEGTPDVDFSLIDCANKTEVRGECGKQGVFYLALKEHGLWKLHYDKESDRITLLKLSKDGDIFYRMGLGVIRPGASYYKDDKAIYTAATIDGAYGFYRSTDDGQSFVRLNTDRQMYGEVNSMEGDSQEYGRFYIATGSRGVLYGEPQD